MLYDCCLFSTFSIYLVNNMLNYNKLYFFTTVKNKCILYNVLTFHSYFLFDIFIYHITWIQYKLSTCLLLSPVRYLCWWTIDPCGYHPPTSQWRSTNMVYYIYYLLKYIVCLLVWLMVSTIFQLHRGGQIIGGGIRKTTDLSQIYSSYIM